MIFHKTPLKAPGFDSDSRMLVNRDVNDEKLSNNLIRAKTTVFELAMCNEFEYFVTLTLSEEKYNRYDLGKYIKDLGQFFRDYRKKFNVNVQYLLIPEPHRDKAWHMHGLIMGIPRNHLEKNKNGYMDWKAYSEKFGYMSIDPVRNQEAVSKYITKYITKNINLGLGVTEKNKKAYYCSRGLHRPEKVKEGTLTSSQLDKIPFDYENDYVKTKMLTGLEYLRLDNQL